MHLEPEQLKIVLAILSRHLSGTEVWAFGSRVHGDQLKKFSDLDLALKTQAPLALSKMAEIKDAFAESDLPFRVDVVDWSVIGDDFKEIIQSQYTVLQPSSLSP